MYNRICKIKRDYKHRIEFLKSMCQYYTDDLSHRMNELAFDEMEIQQKLNKLEWDIIFLQCVGRSLIEASTSYLSEIYFDNIEQTLHKTKTNLTVIDDIVGNNYNLSIAYGITSSEVPSVFASKISDDDNKFIEILQLISNSVQNVQQLPCIVDGNYVDQNNLKDEARKLLTICNNIKQKIMVINLIKLENYFRSLAFPCSIVVYWRMLNNSIQ
ncbi:unnamed protein product [Wuchereria bancrofti]|uniref:Uncharacterized protein n=1 Tax=Wuchereria bancrofti TaxID=6293 RepID=A0A3P7ER27_WUCBA|nr:unnamed protein product [Wuchereria bancrofti]